MEKQGSDASIIVDIPDPSKISSGHNWVDVITKSFRSNLKTERTCVFALPNNKKSCYYAPKWLGLGPYHHFRQGFYLAEKHKLEIVKSFLNLDDADGEYIEEFERNMIGKLIDFEPVIRACYDQYLELDSLTLAWIMFLDSFYLLQHLGLENPSYESSGNLAQDLFVLENQIPASILYEIKKSVPQLLGHVLIPELFHKFCIAHCPFQVQQCRIMDFRRNCRSYHLLDHMHRLILDYNFLPEEEVDEEEEEPDYSAYGRSGAVKFGAMLTSIQTILQLVGANGIEKHIEFVKSLPWQKVSDLFSKSGQDDDDGQKNQLRVDKIEIPSVTQLHKVLKLRFEPSNGGIRDLDRLDPKGSTLQLPVITLNPDSEVILRNLLAYEAAITSPGSTLVLAEYMDFMSGIVYTTEDAKFLRVNNIIKGSLNDDQVASLFNGISKTTGNDEKKSNLQEVMDEMNKRYNSTIRIRLCKFVNKSYNVSWKFVAVFSTVLLIILFTMQSFCNIYGCSSRWFHYDKLNDSSSSMLLQLE